MQIKLKLYYIIAEAEITLLANTIEEAQARALEIGKHHECCFNPTEERILAIPVCPPIETAAKSNPLEVR